MFQVCACAMCFTDFYVCYIFILSIYLIKYISDINHVYSNYYYFV